MELFYFICVAVPDIIRVRDTGRVDTMSVDPTMVG